MSGLVGANVGNSILQVLLSTVNQIEVNNVLGACICLVIGPSGNQLAGSILGDSGLGDLAGGVILLVVDLLDSVGQDDAGGDAVLQGPKQQGCRVSGLSGFQPVSA